MLIGFVSDSHDDMDALKRAVSLFNGRGAGHVVHAGDLLSPFTVEVLGGLKAPLSAIYGNNDGDRLLLRERFGESVHRPPYRFSLEGRRLVVVHEHHVVDTLAKSGEFDLVVYGHTHRPDVRRIGESCIVNPGKAARLYRGRSTVGLMDLTTMETEIVDLF